MKTEEDWDMVYKFKEELWEAVHDLVDLKLAEVPVDIAEEVRQQLTDDFRFWKRD